MLGRAAKAVLGAVIAGLGSLSAVLVGSESLSQVTAGQWVTIILATAVALGGVYAIPNTATPNTAAAKP